MFKTFSLAFRWRTGEMWAIITRYLFLCIPPHYCVFIFKAQLCQQWDLNGILGRQQLLYIVINPAVLMETKDTTGILTIKPATMRFP